MNLMKPQLLWFKRDLRVHDHAPLCQAAAQGPVLAVYVYEPVVIHAPDYAVQHLNFTNECLQELQTQLQALGIPLIFRHGEMCEVLQNLHQDTGFEALWSHEETGNRITYQRDLRVARWCRAQGVAWHESPNNGVVRRLKNRDDWTQHWLTRMALSPLAPPEPQHSSWVVSQDPRAGSPQTLSSTGLLSAQALGLKGQDKTQRLRGGHRAAQALLNSFMDSRAEDYRFGMSSPMSAQQACSRLSPYISFGVVSMRMVVHALGLARAHWQSVPIDHRPRGMLPGLKAFESRLHWHCHFIQKLESQPDIEHRNLHRAYDGLRTEPDAALLAAWTEGRTGVPMVDACMRMLLATGWINFRMRAMLMSFSSYHLWQDWKEPALHLAREFLDYEPGIHYPQVQMQSGTTGINTIRIYSPTKQALDQDPEGEFIRLWCPELKRVPTAYLAEPWTMPDTLQQHLGVVIGRDYPAPVVDVAQAGRFARDTMWALRGEQKRTTQFRAQTQEILAQHASRDPGRSVREQGRRSQRKNASTTPSQATRLPHTPAPQMDLFGALNED